VFAMINAPFVFHAKRNQDEQAHLRTHDGGSGSALSGRCIDAFPTVRNIGCRRSNGGFSARTYLLWHKYRCGGIPLN